MVNSQEHDYSKSIPQKKPSGAFIIDGIHVSDTLKCAHCGAIWAVVRGSRKKRGFCTSCQGFTCGAPACDVCVPLEKTLEGLETGQSQTQLLRDLDSATKTFS